MKKKILITYFKNGDMRNEVGKEIMHETILNKLRIEGKKMTAQSVMHDVSRTTFSDGTVVEVVPFGAEIRGSRFTHIYADVTTVSLGYMNNLKSLLYSNENANFDVSGNQLNVFNVLNGKVNIIEY